MTAEPRDVEEIRGLHGSSGCKATLRGDQLGDFYECSCGWRSDTGTGVGIARVRLAAADRDNAELRGEVEAIWAVVREYLPEAIGHNTLPEIVAGIARQRDGQHEIKDHLADVARKLTDGHKRECYAKLDTEIQRDDLRAQLAAAQAQLAEALARATAMHDIGMDVVRERDDLRARLEAVRALCSSFSAHTFTVDGRLVVEAEPVLAALSATPQPEPEDSAAKAACSACDGSCGVCPYVRPPASDEPARCAHGKTKPHNYRFIGSPLLNVCPGPAASGTPGGGQR